MANVLAVLQTCSDDDDYCVYGGVLSDTASTATDELLGNVDWSLDLPAGREQGASARPSADMQAGEDPIGTSQFLQLPDEVFSIRNITPRRTVQEPRQILFPPWLNVPTPSSFETGAEATPISLREGLEEDGDTGSGNEGDDQVLDEDIYNLLADFRTAQHQAQQGGVGLDHQLWSSSGNDDDVDMVSAGDVQVIRTSLPATSCGVTFSNVLPPVQDDFQLKCMEELSLAERRHLSAGLIELHLQQQQEQEQEIQGLGVGPPTPVAPTSNAPIPSPNLCSHPAMRTSAWLDGHAPLPSVVATDTPDLEAMDPFSLLRSGPLVPAPPLSGARASDDHQGGFQGNVDDDDDCIWGPIVRSPRRSTFVIRNVTPSIDGYYPPNDQEGARRAQAPSEVLPEEIFGFSRPSGRGLARPTAPAPVHPGMVASMRCAPPGQ